MKEYKVFKQEDVGLISRFEVEELEASLNDLASEGWVLKSTAMRHMSASANELIVVMEREAQKGE